MGRIVVDRLPCTEQEGNQNIDKIDLKRIGGVRTDRQSIAGIRNDGTFGTPIPFTTDINARTVFALVPTDTRKLQITSFFDVIFVIILGDGDRNRIFLTQDSILKVNVILVRTVGIAITDKSCWTWNHRRWTRILINTIKSSWTIGTTHSRLLTRYF